MANLFTNGDFEDAGDYFANWTYFDNEGGSRSEATGAAGTASSVRLLTSGGSNVQLYQSGIALTQGVEYRLRFYAYNEQGDNCKVIVRLHQSPFTIIGLSIVTNLSTSWVLHTLIFTCTQTTTNARIAIQMNPYADDSNAYYFDEFEIDVNPPPPSPLTTKQGFRLGHRTGVA